MDAPAAGTLTRRLVIRGDLTTLSLVLVLGGVGLAVAASVGAVGGWAFGPGGVLAMAGIAGVRASRSAWRALLLEVARAHEGYDPGPSPIPWVADALWRRVNGFDPSVDAPLVLLSEVDPLVTGFGRDAGQALTEIRLRPVSPEERELAPVRPVPEGAPVPQKGEAAVVERRLLDTPGRFIALGTRWPICCGRPAVLLGVRAQDRPADALFLGGSTGELEESLDVRGLHGFQCRACGRLYATDPAW